MITRVITSEMTKLFPKLQILAPSKGTLPKPSSHEQIHIPHPRTLIRNKILPVCSGVPMIS